MEKVAYLSASVGSEGQFDLPASFIGIEGPLLLEIGCGKGSFACGLSDKYPESRILALELVPDVLMMAMEKAAREERKNIRFGNTDAQKLALLLPPASVDALYLNFSDPWPKKRNAKRRLTAPAFLEQYKTVLKPGARIFFKTDNVGLFAYSLGTFAECGFTLENVTNDLHASPLAADNIETEYEKNFSAKGYTINYLEAFIK